MESQYLKPTFCKDINCKKRLECETECKKFLENEFFQVLNNKEKDESLLKILDSAEEEIRHNLDIGEYLPEEEYEERLKYEYINLRFRFRKNRIYKNDLKLPRFNPSRYFATHEIKIGNEIEKVNKIEKQLLEDFRSLNRQNQAQVIEYVQTIAEKRGNKNNHA